MNREAPDQTLVREQQFADLVSSLLERIQVGEQLDLQVTTAQHPEFADDLRDIWGTLIVTDVAASEARQFSVVHPDDETEAVAEPNKFNLPRDIGGRVEGAWLNSAW